MSNNNKLILLIITILGSLIVLQSAYYNKIISESSKPIIITDTITITDTIVEQNLHFISNHQFGLDTCHHVTIEEWDDKIIYHICRSLNDELQALKNRGYGPLDKPVSQWSVSDHIKAKKRFQMLNFGELVNKVDYFKTLGF